MNKKVLSLVIAGLMTSSAYAVTDSATQGSSVSPQKESTPTPASKPVNIDDVSYAFGYTMGTNLQHQKINLNTDQFIAGLKESIAGKEPRHSKEEMMQTLMQFQRQAIQERAAQLKIEGEKNKVEGSKFLNENKSKQGVVTLPSGLQYKIITQGNGPKPKVTDTVTVNYSGKVANGEEFASNNDPKNPTTLNLSQVIPGWKEALQLMAKGSTWELYVPSDLAYGERGTQGQIGPNATLVFTIHLIDILKAKPAVMGQEVKDSNPKPAKRLVN